MTHFPELDSKTGVHDTRPQELERSGWLRFVLPSITDLLFVILLISLVTGALAPRLLGDGGTGWHIRNGELILHSHQITRADPFSSTKNGQPWYAWEWLYDALIARIHQATGLNGVVLLTAFVIAATFALTFRRALARGASVPVALFLLVLAIGASAIHLFARPHVFTWLFAIIWFEILDSSEKRADATSFRSLYLLPVLMLLWVNLHGSFVLGFALCAIYLIAGVVRLREANPEGRSAARTWLTHLSLATAISFVVGLANPYGYKLYTHVYQYLSDRFLMNHIDEFRSPDFHGAAQQCFAALLLIAIAALAWSGRKLRLSQVLIVIFAVYSGLYASRNLPVSSILLCLILAPLLSQELKAAGEPETTPLRRFLAHLNAFSDRMKRIDAGSRGHLWAVVVTLIFLLVCGRQGSLGSRPVMNAHFSAQRFPVQAVDFIQAQGIHEPIFSEDYWGGYLIYRLYPRNQVFIDDRHDFYGDAFLKRYLKIIHVEPGWDKELKALDPKWILLPKETTLTNILKEMPEWKTAYEDKTATLFERVTDQH